ncbi:hypothetical protein EW146_g3001 [Bondarzewia mesenterica]|uniref:Homologous-pairing protein 2 winged helix domain-containing protein n=1 Tax=Bondarzewia mesenterica TaxID=1095465 RepID=A0A4V3XFK7_9AGAM|nr:hypothetical protein EW146_g3001 [Bondarzewia mesenterica]
MASKAKSDVKVLKGQEAEERVLEYIKRMNRPFGAVDVSANLKGAVPKTATQKILLALADKGQVTQKLYGKTTFFVANQNNIDTMPSEKLAALELESKTVEEDNKALVAEVRTLSAGTSLVSAEELEQLDTDWSKWRGEWAKRKKIFLTLWSLVSDNLTPQDAKDLAEDLGIEYDTPEHATLERSPLCSLPLKGRKK